ncbi:hypothetical protein VKS41_004521 [Umbelopsis sp. WA50703]
MSHSAGRIVKHLIATRGPLTTNELTAQITEFPQLVSGRYLKTRVLRPMESQQALTKKISRTGSEKPVWQWHLADTESAAKYKTLD